MATPSTRRTFVRKWVNDLCPADFRFGLTLFDSDEARKIAVRARKKRRDDLFIPHLFHLHGEILQSLLDSPSNTDAARHRIAAWGLSDFLIVSRTKEDLIDAICTTLDRGANVWDGSAQWWSEEQNVFVETFWYDPSHDPRIPRGDVKKPKGKPPKRSNRKPL